MFLHHDLTTEQMASRLREAALDRRARRVVIARRAARRAARAAGRARESAVQASLAASQVR